MAKRISVVMVDGSFREKPYAAEYFSAQDFPKDQMEVHWVEFYRNPHPLLKSLSGVQVHTLGNTRWTRYHSSHCFNAGIQAATGEILVIPDADTLVRPDFLSRVWRIHSQAQDLVAYGTRFDEPRSQHTGEWEGMDELEARCELMNPTNYGGCLTVRRKWLLEINGYECHPTMGGMFHANGRDLATRFQNLGLVIAWPQELKLLHPWHPHTRISHRNYRRQQKLIDWRRSSLSTQAILGIDSSKNGVSEMQWQTGKLSFGSFKPWMQRWLR